MGQHIHDIFMVRGHDALAVNFYDTMAHTDAAAFGDAPAEQWADDAVLHAEAELVARVGPFNLHFHDWRARHDRQLHHSVRFHVLQHR